LLDADQKPLKLVRTKLFRSGITKIAVLKVAIGKSELDLVGLPVFLSNDEMRTNSIHEGDVNSSPGFAVTDSGAFATTLMVRFQESVNFPNQSHQLSGVLFPRTVPSNFLSFWSQTITPSGLMKATYITSV
jgi:hypothetical protein